MTGAMPTPGLSYQVVTVLSVDGNTAYVRSDHTGRQFPVARDVLRAHALPPMAGERWIIELAYGTDWTFAAIIGGDPVNPVLTAGNAAERLAIKNPYPNLTVYQLDSYSAWRWTGTAWQERIPPQFAAFQAQLDAKPRGLLKIVRWPTDITIINTASVLMESLALPVLAGRTYKVQWHVNQAGSLAAGPPNGQAAIVTAPTTVVATSPTLRTSGIRVYNGTQEVLAYTGFFDATVNETRAFGATGNSGSGSASVTFYGGQGRHLSVEDVGPTPA